MSERIEYCVDCGDPTGRAGAGDDSIFTDDGHGPLCEGCYRKTPLCEAYPVPVYTSVSTAPAATVGAGQLSPAQVATDAAVEAALEALPSWASVAQQNEAVARATAGLPFVVPESPEKALSEARELLREWLRTPDDEDDLRDFAERVEAWLAGRKP